MDKYIEALNSISSYEIWHSSSYDDEGYCNDDDYTEYPFSDSEDIEILSELITKHDTLNKGIDELLKKYEEELSKYSKLLKEANNNDILDAIEYQAICNFYIKVIQDLKKLKGE